MSDDEQGHAVALWTPPQPSVGDVVVGVIVTFLYTLLLASLVLTGVGIVRNLGRAWRNLKYDLRGVLR